MSALARDFEVIAVEEGERVCVRASQQHVRETQDIAKRPRLVSRACSPKPGCDIGRRGFRFGAAYERPLDRAMTEHRSELQ